MKKVLYALIFIGIAVVFPFSMIGQSKSIRNGGNRSNQTTSNSAKNKTTKSSQLVKKRIPDTKVSDPTGRIGRNGYVDLGLPSGTLWAQCNLGDVFPNGFGHKYAWGKPSIYFGGNSKADGLNIDNIAGNKEYDAATYEWGDAWQIPTYEQWQELIDNCKWQWAAMRGGYEGYKVTGPNGNSIFLPPAGWSDGRNITDAHKVGYYWSSTAYPGNRAFVFTFDKTCPTTIWDYRSTGYSIRAVIKDGVKLDK